MLFIECQTNDTQIVDTPIKALELPGKNEGYAEVIEVYGTLEVAQGRVIVAFKGMLEQEELCLLY